MNGRGQQWLDWVVNDSCRCQDEDGPDDQQDGWVGREGPTTDFEGKA